MNPEDEGALEAGCAGAAKEESIPVALDGSTEGPAAGSAAFGGALNSGCHGFSATGRGGGGALTCCTGGATCALGDGGCALKNCVKLPSGDAESETPGEENPFNRGGAEDAGADGAGVLAGLGVLAAGGVNCGVSTNVLFPCSITAPATKMRVNSPGP